MTHWVTQPALHNVLHNDSGVCSSILTERRCCQSGNIHCGLFKWQQSSTSNHIPQYIAFWQRFISYLLESSRNSWRNSKDPKTSTVSFGTIYFISFHSLSQSLFTPVVNRVGWTGAKGALVNPSACFARGAYSFLKLLWGSVTSPMWEASDCQSQIWPPTNYLSSWFRPMECTGVDFVQLKLSTLGSC